jgi:YbgC/YbaW family acyl-CoA thioester hydrolase
MTQPLLVAEYVRWADVDLVGIMRFSAFTRLVELAEQELFRAASLPFGATYVLDEVWLPRRHLEIDYFAPARLDERLKMSAYVSHVGTTSVTLATDVYDPAGSTLVAAAQMVIVSVTRDSFAKRPLPPELTTALAPYVCSTDAARAWVSAQPAE